MAFAESSQFPFRLLSDPDKATGTVYQVLRDPSDKFADYPERHSYLIDPGGKIAKAYAVTDPAGHASEVLTDLGTLKG